MAQAGTRMEVDMRQANKLTKGLTRAEKKQVFTGAIKKAARPMRQRVRQLTPRGETGNLRKSLGFVTPKIIFRKTQDVVILGFRRKRGKFKGHHAVLVEQGAKRERRGTMRGRFMMKRGTAEKQSGYERALSKEVTDRIVKKFAKLS